MRNTVGALAVVGLAALGLSSAQAADMARPIGKSPVPMYVQPFSWAGFYAGVNAGWGWISGDGTGTVGGVTQAYSGSGNGFLGGAQIGYNLQSGNIVYGLEADFQGSGGSGTVSGTTFTGTAKTPWFGTVRGRLGYAFDRSMLYATGGAVYGKSTFEGTDVGTGAFSNSATYWTWTAGGGYEAMLWDRWSAKLEYLYAGTPSDAPTANGTTALDGKGRTHVLRVGLNYHF